jgi:hypothetical protein
MRPFHAALDTCARIWALAHCPRMTPDINRGLDAHRTSAHTLYFCLVVRFLAKELRPHHYLACLHFRQRVKIASPIKPKAEYTFWKRYFFFWWFHSTRQCVWSQPNYWLQIQRQPRCRLEALAFQILNKSGKPYLCGVPKRAQAFDCSFLSEGCVLIITFYRGSNTSEVIMVHPDRFTESCSGSIFKTSILSAENIAQWCLDAILHFTTKNVTLLQSPKE